MAENNGNGVKMMKARNNALNIYIKYKAEKASIKEKKGKLAAMA